MVAAPSDKQAIQARLALDLVVRAIENKLQNRHVSPTVFVVDRSNIKQFDAGFDTDAGNLDSSAVIDTQDFTVRAER